MTIKPDCSSKCATTQCVLSSQNCTNAVDNSLPFGITIIPGSGALTEVPVSSDAFNCFDDSNNLLECIQNANVCPKAFQASNLCVATCPEFAASSTVNFINSDLVIGDNILEGFQSRSAERFDILQILPDVSNDLLNIFPNLLGINGSLYIVGTNYRNISGFDRLRFVTGRIVIVNNPNLLTIPSFSRLLNVGGQVVIEPPISSPSDVEGSQFSAQQILPINAVCGLGAIIIANNTSLVKINGFDDIRQVKDGIFIADNPCLTSICAFPHLYQTDRIVIKGNARLSAIMSFCYLDSVNVGLYIFNNNSNGDFDLKISGFINLTRVGTLVVSSNMALRSISFDNLTDVCGSLVVRSNPDLQELSLAALRSVGSLLIENNRALEILTIPDIESVTFQLKINANCALQCINSFRHLRRVGHTIVISANPQLVEISGFENLKYVGTECVERPIDDTPTSVCGPACGCIANVEYDWTLISRDECVIVDNFLPDTFDSIQDACGYVLPTEFFVSVCNPAPACGQLDVEFNIPEQLAYSIIIYRNQRLRAIGGFCSLRNIASNLYIVSNPTLHTIKAFPSLAYALDIWIRNNPNLRYINGFSSLISIRDFVVYESKCLIDLKSICSLEFAQNIAIQARCNSSVKYPNAPIPSVFGYTIYYSFPLNGKCTPCITDCMK